MALTVTLDDREIKRFFNSLIGRFRNPQPFLRAAFATIGFRDIIKHFNQEKGPNRKWKKSQRAKIEGGKTLQDTGNLRGNFSPTNIQDVGTDAIVFFNPTPYADQHDSGDKSQNIPQREFMFLSPKAQDLMLTAMLKRFVK